MNNTDNILSKSRFTVADDGFSARVMAALENRPVVTPTFVPRRISVWRAYYFPAMGAAVGLVFLGLLMSRVVDLNQLGTAWGERSELLAQRLAQSPILSPQSIDPEAEQE